MNNAAYLARLIASLPGWRADHLDEFTIEAILQEAGRLADDMKASGEAADRQGCRLKSGRVLVPSGQHRAWKHYVENGWNALAVPERFGGQDLPLTIATAAQMLFDASDVALGMLALNQRCAIRLLEKIGGADLQNIWIPRLLNGDWGATICISEPQAGSDVGRIRTRAQPTAANRFLINGEKCWISYGDHDLTRNIVHFILARSPGLPPGTRGLSLFLLPDQLEDGRRNGVSVSRIEEKLGLHGSPTCVLNFDDAIALPLSEPGCGLSSIFEMIVVMRLGVAAQGSAIASRAAAVASQYAFTREQGGPPQGEPIAIYHHAEVRRMLLEIHLAADTVTMLTMQAAAWIDAGDQGDKAAAGRAAVLLPVAKALAAEAAFDNAHQAIQVLGGAGYTKEWPLERLLRDSRVFSIYEGTTAIQARDLTFRQILGSNRAAARDVLDQITPTAFLRQAVDELIRSIEGLDRAAQEVAALPLMRLFGLACIDGLLRRAAAGHGALALRSAALLKVHEGLLHMRVDGLIVQSRTHFTNALFETICRPE